MHRPVRTPFISALIDRFPLSRLAVSLVFAATLISPIGSASGGQPESKENQSKEHESKEHESTGEEKSGKPAPSARKLLEEAGAIADRVAQIRGLSKNHPIDKGVKTREQLRDILVEKLAEEQSEEEMRQEAAVFKRLGLIPPDLDYRKMILDVLTEQIAGFYDQKNGSLNIMQGIPLDLQRPAMAHEIFHAIQDQHFDLTQMLEPFSSRENGDFQLARSALVEGDATVLMIDFSLYERGTLPRDQIRSIVDIPMMANMLKQLDFDQLGALEKLSGQKESEEKEPTPESADTPTELFDSALSKAPTIVRRVLIFPYLAGMRFVIALRSGRTWNEFDEIYEKPPVSTEQILHPERYAKNDEPVMLFFDPSSVLEDYDKIYETVLGEFQMKLFLEHHLKSDAGSDRKRSIDVEQAATGWDGDRLMAFRQGDRSPLLIHLSVWDSQRDATEYYNALVEASQRRFPEASTRTASGKHGASNCLRAKSGDGAERIYVERWGDAVLHIEGAPSKLNAEGNETNPTTYMVRERTWKTLDRRAFREVYRERMAEKEKSEEKQSEKDE